MSTKIYEAYRIPAHKLNDYIDWSRQQMIAAGHDMARKLMVNVDRSDFGDIPPHIAGDAEGEAAWDNIKRMTLVVDIMVDAANSSWNTREDPSCGLNIWLYKDSAFIVPVGPGAVLSDGPDKFSWCADYCYWNNSDQPDDISDEEWLERRATWDAVNCGTGTADHNARRLWHDIVDIKTFTGRYDFEYHLGTKRMYDWRLPCKDNDD